MRNHYSIQVEVALYCLQCSNMSIRVWNPEQQCFQYLQATLKELISHVFVLCGGLANTVDLGYIPNPSVCGIAIYIYKFFPIPRANTHLLR